MLKDEPEAPEKPQVTDWDEDHVDLAWVKPKSDGGSPITEYIIQKKEKGSPYWVNALNVPASQTTVSINNNFSISLKHAKIMSTSVHICCFVSFFLISNVVLILILIVYIF